MGDYSALSAFMASYPDVMIVRTFATLNVQDILYRQAELAHLEREYNEIAHEDKASEMPLRQAYRTSWQKLSQSESSGGDPLQWRKFLEIRKKLDEYSEQDAYCNNQDTLY